jgi:hypothetical protein
MDGMDSVLRYNPIYGIVGSVKFCRTNRSISALDFLREFDYRADQLAEVAAVAVVDNLAFRTVCSVDPVLIGPANVDVFERICAAITTTLVLLSPEFFEIPHRGTPVQTDQRSVVIY